MTTPTTTHTPPPKQISDRCVNRAALKRRILRLAKTHRPFVGFNRIAESTLDECEFALDRFIVARLQSHPTVGKTVKF